MALARKLVDELDEVAGIGELPRVGEHAGGLQQLATVHEHQAGSRSVAVVDAHPCKWVEAVGEAAARVLRALGDAGKLPGVMGEKRNDFIGFAIGARAQNNRFARLWRPHRWKETTPAKA